MGPRSSGTVECGKARLRAGPHGLASFARSLGSDAYPAPLRSVGSSDPPQCLQRHSRLELRREPKPSSIHFLDPAEYPLTAPPRAAHGSIKVKQARETSSHRPVSGRGSVCFRRDCPRNRHHLMAFASTPNDWSRSSRILEENVNSRSTGRRHGSFEVL